ncbi:hypothetical protein BD324DRAFT_683158 [Kockovaella imperatae]|uniref:G domain-containing protein n=1 Tax=Kockovaella imperatae TaxID=4999 RepID=A0A1Y1UCA9_9TREE|nr:hypothetical protein BD324DRAFT_683158 [Kockovaella imperatae]ORX34715.1 hypothetical protein BD324DRAFT_683158 [Kockovaella imperatae]
MSFPIRQAFHYPLQTPSWYLGHMAKSMKEMGSLLRDINFVIEARDSRLPLTSINPAFDTLLDKVWGTSYSTLKGVRGIAGSGAGSGAGAGSGVAGSSSHVVPGPISVKGKEREKVIVYTKRDLAEEQYEQPLKSALTQALGQKVFFTDTRVDADVRAILKHAVRLAKLEQEYTTQFNILVVGMPNVGKSSLLNALRRVGINRGKAFRTGNVAGVTRKLTGTVKIYEEPPIYVYDTPGVMVPFLGHGDDGAERGFKFALTAGIKDDLLETEVAVDYLLWRLNRRMIQDEDRPISERSPSYLQALKIDRLLSTPSDNLTTFLDAVCQHIGAWKKGGEKDHDAALGFVVQAFRDGKFGRWTMDSLVPTGKLLRDTIPISETSTFDDSDAATTTAAPLGDLDQNVPESRYGSPSFDIRTDGNLKSANDSGDRGSSPIRVSSLSLDESVSLAVREYLDNTAFVQSEQAKGRGLSTNQKRRNEQKARAQVRVANARQKARDKERKKTAAAPTGGGGGGAKRRARR